MATITFPGSDQNTQQGRAQTRALTKALQFMSAKRWREGDQGARVDVSTKGVHVVGYLTKVDLRAEIAYLDTLSGTLGVPIESITNVTVMNEEEN